MYGYAGDISLAARTVWRRRCRCVPPASAGSHGACEIAAGRSFTSLCFRRQVRSRRPDVLAYLVFILPSSRNVAQALVPRCRSGISFWGPWAGRFSPSDGGHLSNGLTSYGFVNQPEQRGASPGGGWGGKAAAQGEHWAVPHVTGTERQRVSQGLDGVRQAARARKQERFTTLLHHSECESAEGQLLRVTVKGRAGGGWRDVGGVCGRAGGPASGPGDLWRRRVP